jgi:HPt (histidine-containing phosphotransfer) domain-containing protein
MTAPNRGGDAPLRSELAGDPEMGELVDLFVGELPDRLRAFEEAWRDRRREDIQRFAHQMRGACASYGFPSIGRAAGAVEDALRAATGASVPDLDRVKSEVDDLVALCRRAMLR